MPRLLDLFCGAGGASVGYARAGFEVVGVDIAPQPRYPFECYEHDALLFLHGAIGDFDAIHASPPCQFATDYRRGGNVKPSANLIPRTRELLQATGLPYIIENVEKARPELRDPMMICGTQLEPPMEIQRHRLFETNWPLAATMWPCRHKLNGRHRYPGGGSVRQTGHSRGLVRATIEVGTWDIPLAVQQDAMGIDWMELAELSQAIPPAYTEMIGRQLYEHVAVRA